MFSAKNSQSTVLLPPTHRQGARREGIWNKFSDARTSKVCMKIAGDTVPKTRKGRRPTGGSHDFYTIISLSSLCKVSICREKVVWAPQETQDARIRAIFNSKSTALTCLYVSPCFFELLCCFAACLAFPYSGASFLEAAKMDTLQSVR